jgi:hypothetical protein
VARILTEAMDRYAGDDSRPLAAPGELLPPLGKLHLRPLLRRHCRRSMGCPQRSVTNYARSCSISFAAVAVLPNLQIPGIRLLLNPSETEIPPASRHVRD